MSAISDYMERQDLLENARENESLRAENARLRKELSRFETKTPCAWCKGKGEYTIIDDDFGQPLRPSMIHFCFNCGRKLMEEAK